MNLGRFGEAADILQRGVATFPESPKSWMLLGQAQIQRSQFQEAEASLRKAIELAPKYTDAYYALATACARQGKHEDGAEYRRRFGELKARDRELEDRLALAPDLDMMRQRTAATLGSAGTFYFQLLINDGELGDSEFTTVEVIEAESAGDFVVRDDSLAAAEPESAPQTAQPVPVTGACGAGLMPVALLPLLLFLMRGRVR